MFLIIKITKTIGYLDRKLNNDNVTLLFNFYKNKLASISYIYTDKYSNENQYISEFNRIGKLLNSKYGYIETQYFWKKDLLKNDESRYGLAVLTGHLLIVQIHENEKTKIILQLGGNNYIPNFTLRYVAKEFESEILQAQEKMQSDNL